MLSTETRSFILSSVKEGRTYASIGRDCGLTRERVRQIAKRARLDTFVFRRINKENSYTEEQKLRRFKKEADRTALSFGCTKKPSRAFQEHKTNAYKRGIEFSLSFYQWWSLWEPYYKDRGRQKGNMVMCRTLDTGPYSIENVRIDSVTENLKESMVGHRTRKSKKSC